MAKVSVVILTRNRSALLRKALGSVRSQSFGDFEIVVVNDGSSDDTAKVLEDFRAMFGNMVITSHGQSQGITASRQEALQKSTGEYVAFLDDDDEWVDINKLTKQVKFLDEHPEHVLAGGGIEIIPNSPSFAKASAGGQFPTSKQIPNSQIPNAKLRPETDGQIRKWMLLKNCFFTSTVMVRRQTALDVGGFKKDEDDFAEDYDLWLRMGLAGKMYNFQEVFTRYTKPQYSKERFQVFLRKQLRLINRYHAKYPYALLARAIMRVRLIF